METRHLGACGLEVQPLCLGTMTFGLQVDEPDSFAILDRAYEIGIRFLDTADAYPLGGGMQTIGETEAIIGRWMRDRGCRDDLVVATKCSAPTHRGLNAHGLSRAHIVQAIEDSLRRLQTDYVDLYQSHAFDTVVPIDETLRAFDDLVAAGKVRYLGCSNYPAWRLGQAISTAGELGIEGYASVQPRYNMLYREIETELLPLCRAEGLGVLVYNPLAGGFLSGKYTLEQGLVDNTRFTLGNAAGRYQERYWQEDQFEAVSQLKHRADAYGVDMVALAVAWVLAQRDVTSAIIGASNPQQLDSNLAALELEISDELKAACDELWWQLPRRPVTDGYR